MSLMTGQSSANVPASVQWTRSSLHEAWLTTAGYAWRYDPTLALEQIDLRASLENPGRLQHRLIDEQKFDMAIAMERGHKFPPIWCYLNTRLKRYIVLAGCHRVGTVLEFFPAVRTIPAYLIEEEDETRLGMLAHSSHTVEAVGETHDARLEHVAYLVTQYGLPVAEAARVMGVRVDAAHYALRVKKAERRAEAMGLKLAGIPAKGREALGGIRSDAAFKAAVDLTRRAALPTAQISALLREINHVGRGGEKAELAAIEAFGARPDIVVLLRRAVRKGHVPSVGEGSTRPDRTPKPDLALIRHLRALAQLLTDRPSLVKLHITTADMRGTLGGLLGEVLPLLKALARELTPAAG